MKLARRATGRSEIIAFVGGFHGRTYGALSLTASKATYRRGMGPLLPGRPPHPLPVLLSLLHAPEGRRLRPRRARAATALRHDHRSRTPWPRSSSSPCRARAATSCRRRRSCRCCARSATSTGSCWLPTRCRAGSVAPGGCSRSSTRGVEPDIMCVAKALGNGMPIAAIVARHRVMRAFHEGEHGTHLRRQRGRLRGCGRGHRDDDARADSGARGPARPPRDGTRARVAGRHSRACRRARPRPDDRPRVHAGRALPRTDLVDRIAANALARGLLVLSCGIDGNVIRLIPPLTIPEAELDAGLDILEAAMREEVAR